MSDREKILKLNERLHEMEHRIVPSWQRPILEVARLALEAEISEFGRRIGRWNPEFRHCVVAVAAS